MSQKVQFASSARRHRVKRVDIVNAMEHATYVGPFTGPKDDAGVWFIGPTTTGIEIEVAAVLVDTEHSRHLKILHAMPVNRKDRS